MYFKIKNSTLVAFNKSGYMPYIEEKDKFFKLLKRFSLQFHIF
jgi:hypothetical protein